MLVRQTLLYFPAQVFGPLMQFLASIVWTHQLDAAAYGIVTYLIAVQELAFLFTLGWWSAFVLRFGPERQSLEGRTMAGEDLVFVLVASLVQGLAVVPILASIHVSLDPQLVAITAWFLIARSAIGHYAEVARSRKAIVTYTIGQLASPMAGTLLSFAALQSWGPDPRWVLASLALTQTLALAAMMSRLGAVTRIRLPDPAMLRTALGYCGPLILAGIPSWVVSNGIRLEVQAMAGTAMLGLLSVGWGLGQRIAAVAAMPVTAAAFPLAVDRLASGDREAALRQVGINGLFILGILAPMSVGSMIIARPLVDLVIAEPFRAITVFVFPVAATAGALRNLNLHGISQVFLLLVRTDIVLVVNAAEAVFTLVLGYVGLRLGGIEGAAVGCLAGSGLGLLVAGIWAAAIGLPIPLGSMLRVLAASALMGAMLLAIPWPAGVAGLMASIAAGGCLYGGLILALFPQVLTGLRSRLRRA